MCINPRRSTKLHDKDSDGWNGGLRHKCSRATLNARKNIDTSVQARASGQPRDLAASCNERRQAGCAKAMVMRGPGGHECHKRDLKRSESRKGTTFELLTRMDEFLKSAKNVDSIRSPATISLLV